MYENICISLDNADIVVCLFKSHGVSCNHCARIWFPGDQGHHANTVAYLISKGFDYFARSCHCM